MNIYLHNFFRFAEKQASIANPFCQQKWSYVIYCRLHFQSLILSIWYYYRMDFMIFTSFYYNWNNFKLHLLYISFTNFFSRSTKSNFRHQLNFKTFYLLQKGPNIKWLFRVWAFRVVRIVVLLKNLNIIDFDRKSSTVSTCVCMYYFWKLYTQFSLCI